MYPIQAVEKHYAWGSYDRLQDMFHLDHPTSDKSVPLAEMWFSGHTESPSLLTEPDGSTLPLTEAIRSNPMIMLGEQDSQLFGPTLPYLFKIISARIPLSLQVHPLDFEARAGFNRENASGLAKDAPERSFKDTLAKNEMVVALEPFKASVGFAPISSQLTLLRQIDHPLTRLMVQALTARTFHMGVPPAQFAQADAMMPVSSLIWPDSRRRVFRAFYSAITAPRDSSDTIGPALISASQGVKGRRGRAVMNNVLEANRAFPGDPSVLSLLMLNPVSLEEGESVYIPAGTPHAYIHGTAAEIMTNSDNVLRAGMTPKHKDIPNLLRSLDCQSAAPIDPSSSMIATLIMHNMVTYRPKINEYMLVYGHVSQGGAAWPLLTRLNLRYGDLIERLGPRRLMIPRRGPRILFCTEGAVQCSTEQQSLTLRQGQAVFIPSNEGRVEVSLAEDEKLLSEAGMDNGSFLLASTPI